MHAVDGKCPLDFTTGQRAYNTNKKSKAFLPPRNSYCILTQRDPSMQPRGYGSLSSSRVHISPQFLETS